jgi:hypothetical protein
MALFAKDRTMERSHSRQGRPFALALVLLLLCSTTGCLHSLIATGIYIWRGGNVVDAQCEDLKAERVVVVCRPPSTNEYRHAGAARSIGTRVSQLLEENVDSIEVVSPREVDNWIDEQDWENFKDLGRAVKATRVVYIELDSFDLYKGTTLYQGDTDVKVTVYDMTKRDGDQIWTRNIGQILFPRNAGIPSADKSVQDFQDQFVEVVAVQTASLFYKHDPNIAFALDAVATR